MRSALEQKATKETKRAHPLLPSHPFWQVILIALAVGISVTTVHSQGYLNFNTLITIGSGAYGAPIYGVNPNDPFRQLQGQGSAHLSNPAGPVDYGAHPPLAGSGFTAQLWGGLDVSSLAPPLAGTGTRGFSANPALAGHLSSGVSAGFLYPEGTILTIQVRAWDNRGGTITSWAQVLADSSVPRGVSATFQSTGLPWPLKPPANIPGMTSFNLWLPIPEPSFTALGPLGLGVLLLRRFRR